MRTRTLATLLAATLLGCSTFASHNEASLYRRIRTTSDDRARLLAASEYASNYPTGAWITPIQALRHENEGQVWAANNTTAEGLAYYVQAYPDGTFIEQARARQAALQTVSAGREQAEERQEQHQEQRAAQTADDRRQWVTRTSQFWVRTLIGIRNYGSPIAQVARANPEFSQAFGAAPAPQCTPERCVKHYHAHYAIPVPGGNRIERQMHVVLRVLLGEGGRVNRIEMLFPNHGFSRWFELENRQSVLDEDPQARMAAIEWALARLEPVIAEVATGSRAIDIIPEPIRPFAQSATEGAGDVTGEEAPAAETPAPTETPAPSEPAAIDPTLDQLMAGATGSETPPPDGSTDLGMPPPPDDEATLALPMSLRALQRGNVQIVVFAAPDGDPGQAFDGFYVERAQ